MRETLKDIVITIAYTVGVLSFFVLLYASLVANVSLFIVFVVLMFVGFMAGVLLQL